MECTDFVGHQGASQPHRFLRSQTPGLASRASSKFRLAYSSSLALVPRASPLQSSLCPLPGPCQPF